VKRDKSRSLLDFLRDETSSEWLWGLSQEAKSYMVAVLWRRTNLPLLLVTSTYSRADDIHQDLCTFLQGEEGIFLLPSREKDQRGERLKILHELQRQRHPLVVASLPAIFQSVPSLSHLGDHIRRLRTGDVLKRERLLKYLIEGEYKFSPLVEEPGDYSLRGGIVDFFSPLYPHPIRVELFDDKIDYMREFDPRTQCSIKRRKEIVLSPKSELALLKHKKREFIPLFEIFPHPCTIVLDEPALLENCLKTLNLGHVVSWHDLLRRPRCIYLSTLPEKSSWTRGASTLALSSHPLTSYQDQFDLLLQDIRRWSEKKYSIVILASNRGQAERLRKLLAERGMDISLKETFPLLERSTVPFIGIGDLRRGFVFDNVEQVFITDEDIFKRYTERRKRWVDTQGRGIRTWAELKEGDYVVHIDYGIGKFTGIRTLRVEGRECDYFQINYKLSDRLYVPIDAVDRLHKYVGDSSHPPPIYSLEGGWWRLAKKRVRKAAHELAASLLHLYSIRETLPGHAFSLDSDWQLEFEASFPYQETPDQLKTSGEVKRNMEKSDPMDVLVCGDAGYGKTEVAMRAAFKAVMDNKQVAILVPTTILAEQHYRTFNERMVPYPITIEMLSRFQRPGEQQRVIQDLKRGRIDIVIGTHRLIQDDVKFKDLALIVIDEEQRFGVIHKKKLREFRELADVLTLSATPIPRSLYMSLVGLRPIYTMFTPPQERQAIETVVTEYNEDLIRRAILRELEREGQTFYLYNRIKDIYRIAEKVRKLVPEASVGVSHGRMPSRELERITKDFLNGKFNVLVCTTIIESGIDMPNVNTLIVEGAEQFGLADTYQLRGRIGRGRVKGYAHFLLNPSRTLTENARKRMEIISQLKKPGSGFQIAMQDLEMRGTGNLLGREQHGHIGAVGFTLYSQLLSEEIKRLKGEKVSPSLPVSLDLKVEARISPSYVPYQEQRLDLYRRIGELTDEEDILKFKEEFRDRYGRLPVETRNLIELLRIKLLARNLGIISLIRKGSEIWARFSPSRPVTEKMRIEIEENFVREIKFLPMDEKHLIILIKDKGRKSLISLKGVLQRLKGLL